MKKNLEKIFASCSIVVAIILIMVLVVTAFGGIDAEEFDSKLVRGLLITLAILYIALSVVSLVLIFVNSDIVKEITLRQEKGGSARVSVGVVTKLVKNTCKEIEGVKCQKVGIVSDEYGVRLKLNVKVVGKDVVEAETYIRTLLEDVFLGEFGFRFSSIEIKVTALTPSYKADPEQIQAKVDARLEQLKEEQNEGESEQVESDNTDEVVEGEQSEIVEICEEKACEDDACDECVCTEDDASEIEEQNADCVEE